MMRRTRLAIAALSMAAIGAGATVAAFALQPDVCEDVTREVGGCDPNQPGFEAMTCHELGVEFGRQAEQRALEIIDSPPSRDMMHATRISVDRTLIAVRLNQHLRRIDLRCQPEEIHAGADEAFSERFREVAPRYLWDNEQTYAWADYLESLMEDLQVVRWWEG